MGPERENIFGAKGQSSKLARRRIESLSQKVGIAFLDFASRLKQRGRIKMSVSRTRADHAQTTCDPKPFSLKIFTSVCLDLLISVFLLSGSTFLTVIKM